MTITLRASVLLPLFLAAFSSATCTSAFAVPPAVTSITPNSVAQNPVPQPTITITGNDFVVGLPSPTNRPTVTLRLNGQNLYSTLGNVDSGGTTITLPPGNNQFNLLQAPLGNYDVIVSRPDLESTTVAGGLSITLDQPPGIGFELTGRWGGPVDDVDVVGNMAYIANGRMMRILNIADPANPVEVGNIDLYAVSGVRVRDGYAYVAAMRPYRFCVVDVSNPAEPKLVWNDYGARNFPKNIYFRGNLAYVRDGRVGNIRVYDITDPHNVVFLGDVNLGVPGEATPEAIEFVGDRMYVAATIFSMPSHPNADPETGSVPESLRIYDFSANPTVPTLIGAYYGPFPPNGINDMHDLAVDGDFACWILRSETAGEANIHHVWIMDVSNPAAPTKVGEYHNDDVHIDGVDIHDGRAYIAHVTDDSDWTQSPGLVVLDIAANPANPPVVGSHKTHGCLRGVRVIGNRTYLLDSGEGLIIMDTTNPAAPVRLGNFYSPAHLREMAKPPGSDLVYVADFWHGFTVLNVADPAHPVVVGKYQAAHYNGLGVNAYGIAYRDNKIYLGAGHLGLEVIDVANPANPVLLGAYRIPASAQCSLMWAVTLRGNIAHVGFCTPPVSCDGGFVPLEYIQNFDITNPPSIVKLGEVSISPQGNAQPPRTIAINPQNIASVGHLQPGRLKIVDLQSVTNPTLLHNSETLREVADVAFDGSILFFSKWEDDENHPPAGVYVQDVSNPVNPVTLTVIDDLFPLPNGWVHESPYCLALQNDRLYSMAGTNLGVTGIHLFDVSNPASPVFLSRSPTFAGGITGNRNETTRLLVEEPRIFSTTADVDDSFGFLDGVALSDGLAMYDIHNLPAPPNPADIAPPGGNGVVNVDDLLAVINSWGPCNPPAALDGRGGGAGGISGGTADGDMNCDGQVNSADIAPFMLALGDPIAYLKAYPRCDYYNGDMNNDNTVDAADLVLFCPAAGGIMLGGQCYAESPCPADIAPQPNGNGVINVDDLLMVINNWG